LIISKKTDGSTIKLSDVAEIVDGIAEYANLNKINGENSVGIMIQKQSDANSVKVCELIKKELNSIEKQYTTSGIKFNIAMDNSCDWYSG
jgi:hydrophobic/amphiphilic exporter-1 (mainly G- bacteria), HAE1 family